MFLFLFSLYAVFTTAIGIVFVFGFNARKANTENMKFSLRLCSDRQVSSNILIR
jgi:hypothetical protein